MLQNRNSKNVLFIPRYDAVKAMRAMEKFTQEIGGYPFLYADIFMTRKEFEEMFDLTGKKNFVKSITKFGRNLNGFFPAYEQVRKKYYANGAFPHLYDKVKPEINVVEVGKQYMDPL